MIKQVYQTQQAKFKRPTLLLIKGGRLQIPKTMEVTSDRKEREDRSSETGPAMAMNLLFLISFSNATLSLRVVNAPPTGLLVGLEEE